VSFSADFFCINNSKGRGFASSWIFATIKMFSAN